MENQDTGRALDWNDAVEEKEFEPLKKGTYSFQVVGFQRKRHEGSDNLPPCPMAELDIQIDGKSYGKRVLKHRLFLHSRTESFLAQFFKSIGMQENDGKVVMDWGKVPGAKGTCEIIEREFVNKSGNIIKTNQISKFLAPTTTSGWQAGSF